MMRGEVPQPEAPDPNTGTGTDTTAGAAATAPRPTPSSRNPALTSKVAHMRLPLSPLVRIDTGAVHPAFPATVLHYWLLTDAQCDALAHFYHQRSPSPWSAHYPCPIAWGPHLSLEEKRRRIGRFIGLQGCESPVALRSEEDIAEEARRARVAEEEAIWGGKMGPWR